jgi:NIMA (never in mitosis gene a)-related kinase
MEGLFNKVCKGQFSRIPDRFSDDLFKIVQYLLQVNSIQRPSCEQILQHPIVLKRIEYFKSFGSEEENEDKCLLKTIHMPKNLLFLSDKLPKPNYDKQFKNTNNSGEEENKNYRSFNKLANINTNNKNNKVLNTNEINKVNNNVLNNIKKPVKLIPLNNKMNNLSNIIEREKEKLLLNKENEKQDILQMNKNKSNILHLREKNPKNILNRNNSNNFSDKILLKKEELNYIDIISKQREDIRKLMLKKNIINRRLNYINNNSQINVSNINSLNNILMPNLNLVNKSAPKKLNNYRIIKNKYYIHSPPYMKNYDKYQKNINKLNYDYGKGHIANNINNVNIINIIQPHKDVLPKLPPRRLSPIKNAI